MVILRICTIYFFSHLPLRDFFSTPPITFLMVRLSVLRVKSRLLSPLPGWSHVLLNRRSMAPVYRHFVSRTAPRGLRVVKSALNPGYGRVKPPLCPGAPGAGVSIDWWITLESHYVATLSWPHMSWQPEFFRILFQFQRPHEIKTNRCDNLFHQSGI